MRYLKHFFVLFLTIFFANYLLPGVDAVSRTKLPFIGGDLLFAIGLALLNAVVYPIVKLIEPNHSLSRLAAASFVLNFVSYALVKFIPVGIQISTVEGYLFVSVVVSGGGFLTNYLEMKQQSPQNLDLEQAAVPIIKQESPNCEAKPTQTKADPSGCFGINPEP